MPTRTEPSDTFAATGEFLADYTAWLYGSGATCVRIGKNVERMARSFGVESQVILLPTHIQVSISRHTRRDNFTARAVPCGINFDINSRLSALSWEVADKHLSLDEAGRKMQTITARKYGNSLEVLLLTSLANASFCRLFGGDAAAMAVVFVATLAGFRIRQIMLGHHCDVRLVFMLCAFISAAISAGAEMLSFGQTPQTAIATSVLYLIPGVPYINAASDLIDRHYLCAFSRFMDALVLTACLSAGLCSAMLLLGLGLRF